MARMVVEELEAVQQAGHAGAEALYQLGLMYSIGRGVVRDNIDAHKWFNLAAVQGCRRAKVERQALAEEMSTIDVAEAQRRAREWLSAVN